MKHKKQSKEGYVLLEGVILVGILGILLTLMLPAYAQYIQRAGESVCKRNCQQLQKFYEIQLMIQNKAHSEVLFEAFVEEQLGVCCPEGGTIKYESRSVTCTKHEVVA